MLLDRAPLDGAAIAEMRFQSFDGTTLAYETEGDGFPVVFLHGIVVDSFINFVRPGLVDAVKAAGFGAVTLDQRGHGESDKPHNAAAYADAAMVRDARAFLDHLDIDRCALLGYSMGAMVAMQLIPTEPRVVAAVLGGVGGATLQRRAAGGTNMIAEAMREPDKRSVTGPGRSFRDFADLVRADREAVAAASEGLRGAFEPDRIEVPTLVICGDNDPLAGDPADLAARMPRATSSVVGGSHLNVVNNTQFHSEVVSFLRAHVSGEGTA